MFYGPETTDRNIDNRGPTKHTAFRRSQSISIILYTKSQRNEKNKAKFIKKHMKYFINFLKKTLNLTLYTMSFTKHLRVSAVQRSRTCSRDNARDFFETEPTNKSAFSLINHDGMPSGPVAVFGLREDNFKKTLSVDSTYGAVVMSCC